MLMHKMSRPISAVLSVEKKVVAFIVALIFLINGFCVVECDNEREIERGCVLVWTRGHGIPFGNVGRERDVKIKGRGRWGAFFLVARPTCKGSAHHRPDDRRPHPRVREMGTMGVIAFLGRHPLPAASIAAQVVIGILWIAIGTAYVDEPCLSASTFSSTLTIAQWLIAEGAVCLAACGALAFALGTSGPAASLLCHCAGIMGVCVIICFRFVWAIVGAVCVSEAGDCESAAGTLYYSALAAVCLSVFGIVLDCVTALRDDRDDDGRFQFYEELGYP